MSQGAIAYLASNPDLDRLPIYYISTHGIYDARDPWDEDDETYQVQAGEHIFETMTMGDLCLAGIDPFLWAQAQGPNRHDFLNKYFTGRDVSEVEAKLFQNLTYYGPGTVVAKRTLSIGGGRTEAREMGNYNRLGERETIRADWPNMGFYKFDVSGPSFEFPARPLAEAHPARLKSMTGLRNALIHEGSIENANADVSITSDEMVAMIQEKEGPGGIFFFSSCAEIAYDGLTPAESLRRRTFYENLQRAALLRMGELGIPWRRGGPGAGSAPVGAFTPGHELEQRMRRIMAAQAAASAAGGTVVPGGLRGANLHFAPSQEIDPYLEEAIEFADAEEADRAFEQEMALLQLANSPGAPAVPSGHAVYYIVIKEGPAIAAMRPVMLEEGNPYLTKTGLHLYLRQHPLKQGEILYRYRVAPSGPRRGKGVFLQILPKKPRVTEAMQEEGGTSGGKLKSKNRTRRSGKKGRRTIRKNRK